MINKNTQFILASASPRRAELLTGLGARFLVAAADVDESAFAYSDPSALVLALARMKCAAVAPMYPALPVLAADTVVYLDGAILGKPRDRAEASAMLRRLSGRGHTVYTGVCVRIGDTERYDFCSTDVYFRDLSDSEIDRYVASGEPLDKAGAYGIQRLGALLVARVDGDYFNVVGLPLVTSARLLSHFGIILL